MINNLLIQADKKVLVAGELSKMNKSSNHGINRIDALGDIDEQFNSPRIGFNDTVTAIIQDHDGRIIIAGTYMSPTSNTKSYIVGLNQDGTVGDWFKSEFPDGSIHALLRLGDGKLLAGGQFNNLKGSLQHGLTRLTCDNDYDGTFKTEFHDRSSVLALNEQADGKILVGGNFQHGLAPNTQTNLVRLNTDGSNDSNFNHQVDDWVFSVLEQENGQVLIGGVFKQIDNKQRKYIARFNADGSLDNSFNPDLGEIGWVYSIALQADGRIVIGGEFTSVNGVERNHVARLNVDGSLDDYFDIGEGANASVKVVKMQDDGRILIGGEFTKFNDEPRHHIAKVNEDGSLDLGFGDSLDIEGDEEEDKFEMQEFVSSSRRNPVVNNR